MNLTPHATADHWTAGYVGRAWSESFNCWNLVQAVEREVFGRTLVDLPIGTAADQTDALQQITAQFRRVEGKPMDGDIVTMIGAEGLHVGVVVQGVVLHNVGGKREDGREWGSVRPDTFAGLGRLGYGHVKLWRAA